MAKQPGENKVIDKAFGKTSKMGYALEECDDDDFESNHHYSGRQSGGPKNKRINSGKFSIVVGNLKELEERYGEDDMNKEMIAEIGKLMDEKLKPINESLVEIKDRVKKIEVAIGGEIDKPGSGVNAKVDILVERSSVTNEKIENLASKESVDGIKETVSHYKWFLVALIALGLFANIKELFVPSSHANTQPQQAVQQQVQPVQQSPTTQTQVQPQPNANSSTNPKSP